MRSTLLLAFVTAVAVSCERTDVRNVCADRELLGLMRRAKLLVKKAEGLNGWYYYGTDTIVLYGDEWERTILGLDSLGSPKVPPPKELQQLIVAIRGLKEHGFWTGHYFFRERDKLVLVYSGSVPNDNDIGNLSVIESADYLKYKGKHDYELLDTCNGVALFLTAQDRYFEP